MIKTDIVKLQDVVDGEQQDPFLYEVNNWDENYWSERLATGPKMMVPNHPRKIHDRKIQVQLALLLIVASSKEPNLLPCVQVCIPYRGLIHGDTWR